MAFSRAACCTLAILFLAAPLAGAESALLFEREIEPLLAAKCGKCHGEEVQKADLDLSSMNGLRRGGESGEPAIAATPDDSLLWLLVEGGEMPPADEPPLDPSERALLRAWIAAGAPAEQPAVALPEPLNQHDVLPILLLRCAACHGARLQRGGLDLRSIASLRAGSDHGPVLVPGDPAASLLIERIETEACPPRGQLLKYFVRRPPGSELQVLRDWIAAGAPEAEITPDVATLQPDKKVTAEDREHWAFQPPQPTAAAASIDAFIGAKLQEAGLDFAPAADRDTLIRRAYFDLLGIPPSVADWQRWRRCEDPAWYAAMIDELLASPRYGERWGRYWLDLVGYADSEGGVSADPIRPVAWKYRDYVIAAFNEDKPYDRFLVEQLAGDELIDFREASTITPEIVENLTATGMLRMGIDQTGSRTMNFVPERLGVIGDAIRVVGSSVMGLTLECARCHSHRYDPIPHRDYYRFKAIFQGAFDEHDWLSFKNRYLEVATAAQRARVAEVNPPLQRELRALQKQQRAGLRELRLETLRQHYPAQAEADRQATLVALGKADNQRTLPQRKLVEQLTRAELLPAGEQPASVLAARRRVARLEDRVATVQRQLEPPPKIRALWDRGEPSPTYILHRGEHNKPGRLVGPGVPAVLTDGQTPFTAEAPFPQGSSTTGRRLAFARWLTQPDHPLTARVMVNRLWYHHFGNGLVNTLENFGRQGERPSHPKLLDWLARRFVQRGWSLKAMHRVMMNSRTYRQSSRIDAARRQRDPAGRLLSRMPVRRMDAEALRDALLFVSGKLDRRAGGPPDRVSVNRDGLVSVVPGPGGGWRRSVYLQYRRTQIPTMMETFDYPEMGPNCVARTVSTVSPQALLLRNNATVRQLATGFAEQVWNARVPQTAAAGKAEGDPGNARIAALVEAVYQRALSRSPSEPERGLGVEALRQLSAEWDGDQRAALETYCHAILNSAAFLYID